MRGGKRQGAGRKSKESTVVMRVPASLVDDVKQLIASRLNDVTEFKSADLSRLSEGNLNNVTQFKAVSVSLTDAQKAVLKILNYSAPKPILKKLRRDYGSLVKAVLIGVYYDHHQKALFIPRDSL